MTSIIDFFRTNKKFRKNWSFLDFCDKMVVEDEKILRLKEPCY